MAPKSKLHLPVTLTLSSGNTEEVLSEWTSPVPKISAIIPADPVLWGLFSVSESCRFHLSIATVAAFLLKSRSLKNADVHIAALKRRALRSTIAVFHGFSFTSADRVVQGPFFCLKWFEVWKCHHPLSVQFILLLVSWTCQTFLAGGLGSFISGSKVGKGSFWWLSALSGDWGASVSTPLPSPLYPEGLSVVCVPL